jgi:beta-lactamase regulating signal transducer with metallopeptidase domain
MTLTKSKWMFASIWLVGAGLVFLILVVQSLVGRYGAQSEAAWAWYLPTVMPTLSLIIGVLATDFRIAATANATAAASATAATTIPTDAKILPVSARGLLWLGVGLSVFYLLLVAVTILAQPFLQDVSPIELMHRSNLWLGPLQGLTAGVLAAFFRSG